MRHLGHSGQLSSHLPSRLIHARDAEDSTHRDQWRFMARTLVAFLLCGGLVGTLLTQLYRLQVVNHAQFHTQADANRLRLLPLPPTRGRIFDRNGRLLADNLPSYHVELTRAQVTDLDAALNILTALLHLSEEEIQRFRRQLQRSNRHQPTVLKGNLTDAEVAQVAARLHRLPGVAIQTDLTRHYPLTTVASHVIGYVGRVDKRDLERLDSGQYRGTTHTGKEGVERFYETELHGRVGHRLVEMDAAGRIIQEVDKQPATAGKNLYLSLDIGLQQAAETALGDHNGAVVAIDPRNGEILAMASRPTFDPNLFVNGISHDDYQRLSEDKNRPLFHRALRGMYPPGSTIKPFVALAALEGGFIHPDKQLYCPGYFSLPNSRHRFRDWKRSGHGMTNVYKALYASVDVYFYRLSMEMGIQRMHDYLALFDIGRPIGVDLPFERTGVNPSPAWKQASYGKTWLPGETVIASIGQGYMLTTPLQLAHATATLANRGRGFTPRILHSTEDQGDAPRIKTPPQPLAPIPISQAHHWTAVTQGLEQVVHGKHGTARKVGKTLRYRMAGKTGTAQVFSLKGGSYNARNLPKHLHDHALFMAFAPADNPQIAVAVIAEHGGGGSSTAAPIARQVTDAWLKRRLPALAVRQP